MSPAERERLRRYKEAETAFVEGDVDGAKDLFQAIIEEYPDSEEVGKAREFLDILQ